MTNTIAETVIGAGVVAVAIGFVAYATQSNGLGAPRDNYALTAAFRNAQGIAVGTDVRLAGIRVGTVHDMTLDPTTFEARVDFTVRRDLDIPEDSDVKITSEGLLGGSFLEITPGASEFMLSDGGEVLNTQSSIDFLNLLMRFGSGE